MLTLGPAPHSAGCFDQSLLHRWHYLRMARFSPFLKGNSPADLSVTAQYPSWSIPEYHLQVLETLGSVDNPSAKEAQVAWLIPHASPLLPLPRFLNLNTANIWSKFLCSGRSCLTLSGCLQHCQNPPPQPPSTQNSRSVS